MKHGAAKLTVFVFLTLLAVLAFPTVALAVTTPAPDTWTNMQPSNSPLPRWSEGTMVYDPTGQRTILFGGYGATDSTGSTFSPLNDTWAYDVKNNSWANLGPADPPTARYAGAVACDSEDGTVILFGGWDFTGQSLGDTWAYDPSTNAWTDLSPVQAPPPRYRASMVYDSTTGEMLLFGGVGSAGVLNDLWAYSLANNTWTELCPTSSPPARMGQGMVYDSVADRVLLFGGVNGNGNYPANLLGDTWSYDRSGNTWNKLNPRTSPSPRTTQMAYDASRDRVVLFGGLAGYDQTNPFVNDTWSYDPVADDWTQLAPASAPAPRGLSAMVYDVSSDEMTVFAGGGNNEAAYADTWAYVAEPSTATGTNSISGMVKDSNGAALAGRSVTLSIPNDRRVAMTTTAADGTYSFTGLDPRIYLVQVGGESVSGGSVYQQRGKQVDLTEGNAVLDFAMNVGYTMSGQVFDTYGNPFPGCPVITPSADPGYAGVLMSDTCPDGTSFIFSGGHYSGLFPGHYKLCTWSENADKVWYPNDPESSDPNGTNAQAIDLTTQSVAGLNFVVAVHDYNKIMMGPVLVAQPDSSTSIAVRLPFLGDDNHTASATVSCTEANVTNAVMSRSQLSSHAGAFASELTNLTVGQTYDIVVTVSDSTDEVVRPPENGPTAGVSVTLAPNTDAANPSASAAGCTVTFSQVNAPGYTAVEPGAQTPPPQFTAGGVCYEVTTTSTYSGLITISFPYNTIQYPDPSLARVFHLENGEWNDVTTKVENGLVYAQVTSLSPFVVTEIGAPEQVSAGGPYTVHEGSSVSLSATASDPQGETLSCAWDLNGDGTFETPGQTVAFSAGDGPASIPVSVMVTNTDGLATVAQTSVTVENVPPTVGTLSLPPGPKLIGSTIAASAPFGDPGVVDTHTALWSWGDGSTSSGIISESQGSGCVAGSHAYGKPGLYTVSLTVTDKDGGQGTASYQYLVFYDPKAGFLASGGWINSPVGAVIGSTAAGKAEFSFACAYVGKSAAPSGLAVFTFPGAKLVMTSLNYEWLVVTGPVAYCQGTCIVNGKSGYRFLVAVQGGYRNATDRNDRIRIRIWNIASGKAIYDTQPGALLDATPTLPLGGGAIVIHK